MPRRKHKPLVISSFNQTALANASGISGSTLSRLLSADPEQQRTKVRLETLEKLQAGLRLLARRLYTVEEIAAAIKRESVAEAIAGSNGGSENGVPA